MRNGCDLNQLYNPRGYTVGPNEKFTNGNKASHKKPLQRLKF